MENPKEVMQIQLVANCDRLDFLVPQDLCPHVGRCGGCTYYDTPYEQELAEKLQALQNTMGEHGHFIKEVMPAPNVHGYRNKMELAFGDTGKRTDDAGNPLPPEIALGIRKRRNMYEVATTERCILMCDDFKQIAAYAMQFFRDSGEAVYHRRRHVGALRHLMLRRGEFTGEILVMLSTTSALTTNLTPFVEGLRALPIRGALVGILHATHDGVSDTIKSDDVSTLWGRDFYHEKLYKDTPGELTFAVSAFSFFQTNSAGAMKLYNVVRDYAGAGNLAYDLYCGTGTIAQVIAPAFERVVGIELVPEAIEAAKANAAYNGIAHCEFHAHDITVLAAQNNALLAPPDGTATGTTSSNTATIGIATVGTASNNAASNNTASNNTASNNTASNNTAPEAIVVDPPRDGLSPKALAKVVAMGAARIVYVACKPASLARDLPVLIAAGYTVVAITGVDMFPRTPHVEAVALLIRVDA